MRVELVFWCGGEGVVYCDCIVCGVNWYGNVVECLCDFGCVCWVVDVCGVDVIGECGDIEFD